MTCAECDLYRGTDKAPPPHDHPDGATMADPEYHEHVAGDRHAHPYNGPHSHGGVSALVREPSAGAGAMDLPDRVVVGANGAYWRDYGTHYSMCPVSTDNDSVEVVAVYVAETKRTYIDGLAERALTPTGDHHVVPGGYCLDCQGQHISEWDAEAAIRASEPPNFIGECRIPQGHQHVFAGPHRFNEALRASEPLDALLDAIRAYGDARADVAYGRATRKAIDLAWERVLAAGRIPPMDRRASEPLEAERWARALHRQYPRDPLAKRIEWDDLDINERSAWRRHAERLLADYAALGEPKP